jgi:sugar lactone lactonase YvrE
VADINDNRIRKIVLATGVVSTLAGDGTLNYLDATGAAAQFNGSKGIAIDGTGTNLYVADSANNRIRKIVVATGVVTTLAGDGTSNYSDNANGLLAQFKGPTGIVIDATGTNLYVAEEFGSRIRKIVVATGAVTTKAGDGTLNYSDNANGLLAQFSGPRLKFLE